MVVRKVLPCGTIRAVILAHRAPLPLGQIRPPALPVLLPGTRFFKSAVFDGLYSCHGVLDSLTGKKWHTMVSLFCLRISCTATRAPARALRHGTEMAPKQTRTFEPSER